MANLTPSLNLKAPPFEVGSSSTIAAAAAAAANMDRRMQSAEHLVLDLCNPDLRENALLELSKLQPMMGEIWDGDIEREREFRVGRRVEALPTEEDNKERTVSRFGPIALEFLWYSCCSSAGNSLHLPSFITTKPNSCNRIEFAMHSPYFSSHSLYLYPFLNTTSKSRPFEYLRLTSLGVIGALVKVDDTEVISFLLSTEIIPLCLRTMEMGSELSKTVATFIVQKILLDDVGLEYICTTAERFFAVGRVLGNMVAALAEQPSSRLLKHIIRCYLRLSDNPRKIRLQEGGYNNWFTMCKGLGLPCKQELVSTI
ncbi:UNVERIFIED_CONTAM: CCR4-NOT transcription complex subunit [Sesamum angustifolium]|uniref:CCR4-NOT transcription complex subunit n=1 Tax=Sesamum angustifolium TaxID=2727405 RepID=A0AAW2KVE1_9LAMI